MRSKRVKTLRKATQALSSLLSSSAGRKLGSYHSLIIPILLLLLLSNLFPSLREFINLRIRKKAVQLIDITLHGISIAEETLGSLHISFKNNMKTITIIFPPNTLILDQPSL